MQSRGGTEIVSREIPFLANEIYTTGGEKSSWRARKHLLIVYTPPPLPSSKTTPPAKRGLEACLKIKLNLASRVGREVKV